MKLISQQAHVPPTSRVNAVNAKIIVQNKTNSENRHLVFLIFKKKQENDGVGDILSLFQKHCQTKYCIAASQNVGLITQSTVKQLILAPLVKSLT